MIYERHEVTTLITIGLDNYLKLKIWVIRLIAHKHRHE